MPLMPLIQARRRTQLVAKVALAVLLRPARLHVLLPAHRRRPLHRHGILRHDLLLVTGPLLLRAAQCSRRSSARARPLHSVRNVAAAALASRPGRCFVHPQAARFFEVPTSSAECLRLKDVSSSHIRVILLRPITTLATPSRVTPHDRRRAP